MPQAPSGPDGPPVPPQVPPELRVLVGSVAPPRSLVVEAGAVRRFREATALPPLADRDGAPDVLALSVVPPTFFCPDPITAAESMGLPRPRPLAHTIDGGSEWEIKAPVRVGDTLTLVARVSDVYAKQAGAGRRPMIVTVVEVLCWNQHGALVGIARGRSVSYDDRTAA